MKNKKADVGITILVIGVIALVLVALMSFINSSKNKSDVLYSIAFLDAFNLMQDNFLHDMDLKIKDPVQKSLLTPLGSLGIENFPQYFYQRDYYAIINVLGKGSAFRESAGKMISSDKDLDSNDMKVFLKRSSDGRPYFESELIIYKKGLLGKESHKEIMKVKTFFEDPLKNKKI